LNKLGKRARVTKQTIDRDATNHEERVLALATQELVLHHGGLFVATAGRQTRIKGTLVWIIDVTVRYPTGHEGYVGDLLYDGEQFTFLTHPSVVDERVRQIEVDPEAIRKWNEYRASTSRTGKA
jgi:hypothetical protein